MTTTEEQLCGTSWNFAALQLNALAETKDWDGLEAFSRERKPSPVTGYEPFIGACKYNSAPNERTARQVLSQHPGRTSRITSSGLRLPVHCGMVCRLCDGEQMGR